MNYKSPKWPGWAEAKMDPEQITPVDLDEISSTSSTSGDEGMAIDYFAAYDTMPCGASDMEDEEGMGMDYDRLVTEEGLAHLLRSAPLGSRLEPLATFLEVVERIAVMKPLDPTQIVDLDTLVVCPEDRAIIGKVIEVFGPVDSPLYSVLCHAEYLNDGTTLTPHRSFSFLPEQAGLVKMEELRAQKITDADEGEGGEDFYSDDEEEAAARRQRKPKRKAADLEPGEIEE